MNKMRMFSLCRCVVARFPSFCLYSLRVGRVKNGGGKWKEKASPGCEIELRSKVKSELSVPENERVRPPPGEKRSC